MNCPGAVLVFGSESRSYRDLPLKLAELGTVHRHEKSGTLHGLMRVRCFSQDDSHIFMTPDQVTEQIKVFMNMREMMSRMSRGNSLSMLGSLFSGNGIADIANMMQNSTAVGPAADYASNGTSHAAAAARNREKARKDARRKMAKEARKKNRHR